MSHMEKYLPLCHDARTSLHNAVINLKLQHPPLQATHGHLTVNCALQGGEYEPVRNLNCKYQVFSAEHLFLSFNMEVFKVKSSLSQANFSEGKVFKIYVLKFVQSEGSHGGQFFFCILISLALE